MSVERMRELGGSAYFEPPPYAYRLRAVDEKGAPVPCPCGLRLVPLVFLELAATPPFLRCFSCGARADEERISYAAISRRHAVALGAALEVWPSPPGSRPA